MSQGSWGSPQVDKVDQNILRRSFSVTQRSVFRRELRSVAEQFRDMPYREARRALRYKVRDLAKLYGVDPEVILQAINCSDVREFIYH
jgi:hypothetical protein